jgi:hypothetical protein
MSAAEQKWLQVIANDTDDEAVKKEKKEKALAEHVACHPEDAGRTVEDFDWIRVRFVKWPREPGDPPLPEGEYEGLRLQCGGTRIKDLRRWAAGGFKTTPTEERSKRAGTPPVRHWERRPNRQ